MKAGEPSIRHRGGCDLLLVAGCWINLKAVWQGSYELDPE